MVVVVVVVVVAVVSDTLCGSAGKRDLAYVLMLLQYFCLAFVYALRAYALLLMLFCAYALLLMLFCALLMLSGVWSIRSKEPHKVMNEETRLVIRYGTYS